MRALGIRKGDIEVELTSLLLGSLPGYTILYSHLGKKLQCTSESGSWQPAIPVFGVKFGELLIETTPASCLYAPFQVPSGDRTTTFDTSSLSIDFSSCCEILIFVTEISIGRDLYARWKLLYEGVPHFAELGASFYMYESGEWGIFCIFGAYQNGHEEINKNGSYRVELYLATQSDFSDEFLVDYRDCSVSGLPKKDTKLTCYNKTVEKGKAVDLEAKLEEATFPYFDLQSAYIKFYIDDVYKCTSGLTDSNGIGKCSYTPPLAGTFTVKAVFDPAGEYNGSQDTATLTVTEPITKYKCTGSPDYQCIEDPTGIYDSLSACQAVCEEPGKLLYIKSCEPLEFPAGSYGIVGKTMKINTIIRNDTLDTVEVKVRLTAEEGTEIIDEEPDTYWTDISSGGEFAVSVGVPSEENPEAYFGDEMLRVELWEKGATNFIDSRDIKVGEGEKESFWDSLIKWIAEALGISESSASLLLYGAIALLVIAIILKVIK